jgi:enediyne biosynthesis protein E4
VESVAPLKTAPRLPVAPPGPAWFTEMIDDSGVDFRHQTGTNFEKPFPAANGSGVAALDYDLDGRCDLYFATGTPFPIDPQQSETINRIYRNLGEWRFQDVTDRCGLGHNGYSAGLAVGDYDADGFPDVYVTCYGANVLFHNRGDGTFARVEASAGVDDPRWGTSAAFLDYDGDGGLDLYVCNYAQWTWESRQYCGDRVRNVRIYCSPASVEPVADALYRNRGDGAFEDVTASCGAGGEPRRGQGVVAADLNDDGWIDLYVTNDLNPNSLLINRGDGTFRDATELSGAGYDHRGRSQAGMGVDAADFNGDGRIDLFVTNFQAEHNTLYENLGGDLFQDVTHRYGLADASLPWVGWGTALADLDLNGALDAIVVNGHVDDNRHLLGQEAPYASPPLIWRQVQGRFELHPSAGSYFSGRYVARGLTLADLDGDGDLDLAITHQDDRPALLRNDCFSPANPARSAIAVRLIGTRSNRDAVGAVVTLRNETGAWVQPVKGGGSYLSAGELQQVFALPAGAAGSLEVRWPGGARSTVAIEAGTRVVIIEPRDIEAAPLVYARSLPP